MSGASQVPDTLNLAMRGGRGGSSILTRGGKEGVKGLSRPVAQCDLPSIDVTVTCGDKGEGSTSHKLAALKLANGGNKNNYHINATREIWWCCGSAAGNTDRHKSIKTRPTKEV